MLTAPQLGVRWLAGWLAGLGWERGPFVPGAFAK